MKASSKLSLPLLLVGMLIFSLAISLRPLPVVAKEMLNRSVVVTPPTASAIAQHAFQFTMPSTSILGSVVFEYCSNSPLITDICNAPAGLNVSSAALSSQSGNNGFSIDNADTTPNKLVISRLPLAGAVITTTYNFSNITNPSSAGETVFVRISTHASNNGSGAVNDNGSVGFVTAPTFNINAYVPPILKFCVAVTVAQDCSLASGSTVDLGVLSARQRSAGISQFSTATNDPSGYVINVIGTTMTSGNNVIGAVASPSPSLPGNNQFGINLRANNIIGTGNDPTGPGTGAPAGNYNTPNFFMYSSGDTIASDNQTTDFTRMTVTYLTNVKTDQEPGIYSTTLTYVATVQF